MITCSPPIAHLCRRSQIPLASDHDRGGGAWDGNRMNQENRLRPVSTVSALAASPVSKNPSNVPSNTPRMTRGDSQPSVTQAVQHVVRVSFLGTVGILANSLEDVTPRNNSESYSVGTSFHPNYPSLLFPPPSKLCVVAMVSRNYTARGIPSGMSKCLVKSNVDQLLANSTGEAASPVARTCDPITLTPSFTSDPVLDHQIASISLKLDENQGSIEILENPSSQSLSQRSASASKSSATSGTMKHPLPVQESLTSASSHSLNDSKNCVNKTTNQLTLSQGSERYVAVWEESSSCKKNSQKVDKKENDSNRLQLVNDNNCFAFEADLYPSSIEHSSAGGISPSTPKPRAAYAPKSFCVTVGLAPDASIGKPVMESKGQLSYDSGKKSERQTQTFAIPLGVANLVINGEETLDGEQLQIDLPLTSLTHVLGNFGENHTNNALSFNFPLIQLAADMPEEKNHAVDGSKENPPVKQETPKSKSKRKNIMSRIFSRSKNMPIGATKTDPVVSTLDEVYNGVPCSIFDLGRPPNSKERNLFLERYNIDPSGDALIRLGLEVFPRGSELEKIFRRNRAKKEQSKRTPQITTLNAPLTSPDSRKTELKKTTSFTRDASSVIERSLVDEEDDDVDSDSYDDLQYFYSLDSSDSTPYTSKTYSSYDSLTDSSYAMSSISEYQEESSGRLSPNLIFGRMFGCKLDGLVNRRPEASPKSATKSIPFPAQLTNILNLNCAGSQKLDDFPQTLDDVNDSVSIASESLLSDTTPVMRHADQGGLKSTKIKHDGLLSHEKPSSLEVVLSGGMFESGQSNLGEMGKETSFATSKQSSLESYSIPLLQRTVTVANEESSMATIVQRSPQVVTHVEGTSFESPNDTTIDQAKGLELTLEDLLHQNTN